MSTVVGSGTRGAAAGWRERACLEAGVGEPGPGWRDGSRAVVLPGLPVWAEAGVPFSAVAVGRGDVGGGTRAVAVGRGSCRQLA
ncbi:MAG: hypothetical protein ACYDGN_12335 [Acidimicrobiales bacterium]